MQENRRLRDEIKALGEDIDSNFAALKNGDCGKDFQLGSASFQHVDVGRNRVLRITGESTWYLKIPLKYVDTAIDNEDAGLTRIQGTIEKLPQYQPIAEARVSREKGYILTAEIEGEQLNYGFYRACLSVLPRRMKEINQCFFNLGVVAATFHQENKGYKGECSSKDVYDSLQRRIERLTHSDNLIEKILKWFEINKSVDENTTFIHGNLSLKNILCSGEKIGLLDFEACGAGQRYHDMATLCRDIIACRSAAFFPWKRAQASLLAFLEGYKSIYPYDKKILLNHVAAFFFARYLQVYHLKKQKESIAGIPVTKFRFVKLVNEFLDGRACSLFEPGS